MTCQTFCGAAGESAERRCMTVFYDFDALRAAVGTEIGTSDWMTVSRDRIARFASATGDHQWIPLDSECVPSSPDRRAITPGFLIVALLAPIMRQVLTVRCARLAINYGLDGVRFIDPVPVGSRIRGAVTLTSVTDVVGGVQAERTITITAADARRPACVAKSVGRYLI